MSPDDVIRAGGGHPVSNEMLDKLTRKECAKYIESGELPRGWRRRKGKKKRR